MPPKPATTSSAAKASTPAAAAAAKHEERPEEPPTPAPAEDENVIKTGSFSFPDGTKYEGEYRLATSIPGPTGSTPTRAPVRHGKGRSQLGPEHYDGDWENDQMHGRGVYRFATGAVYEGEFHSNLFHGRGRYTWADGASYEGPWAHGRMHGDDGRYLDKDGVEWRGRFVNGKYDNGRIFHTLR